MPKRESHVNVLLDTSNSAVDDGTTGLFHFSNILKGKAFPLQAWSGTEGSRKLRFPDFMTAAQDGGEVVSLTHRSLYPQEIHLVLISVRG
jgi:hypothetical protein